MEKDDKYMESKKYLISITKPIVTLSFDDIEQLYSNRKFI